MNNQCYYCDGIWYLCQLFWVDRVASAIIGPIFAVSLKGKILFQNEIKHRLEIIYDGNLDEDNDNGSEGEYDYGYYQ